MTVDETGFQARPAIHDLQARIRRASLKARPRRRGPSRAARLHLIDILSRWAGSGLALISGTAIYVAIVAGRSYPVRAAVWTGLVLIGLMIARRMLRAFRSGDRSAAYPFRWRANYTSAMTVASAAFGAGAIILLPPGAPPQLIHQTLALLIAASLGAGIIHSAHGRAALAATAPAFAFIFIGALSSGEGQPALWGAGAAFTTGAASLFFFHSYLRQKIVQRFPRTTFLRRGIPLEVAGNAESAAVGAATGAA